MEHQDFELKLFRLKTVFRLREDREVASLLGLSGAAFAMRKSRGAFPDNQLRLLAKSAPDVAAKVALVLNGPPDAPAVDAAVRTARESLLNAGVADVDGDSLLVLRMQAEHDRLMSASRQGLYAQILALLNRASDDTVAHVYWMCARFAQADLAEDRRLASRPDDRPRDEVASTDSAVPADEADAGDGAPRTRRAARGKTGSRRA